MIWKTKNKKTETNNDNNNPENTKSNSKIKSWLTGKLGSFLLLSGVGFALYKLKIIPKIIGFFKKDKGKDKDTKTTQPTSTL